MTNALEYDQWTIDAANGIVPYPWLDGHHAGVHNCRHDCGRVERAALFLQESIIAVAGFNGGRWVGMRRLVARELRRWNLGGRQL